MYLFDFIYDRYGLVNRQMGTVNFQATSRRRVSSVVIFFFFFHRVLLCNEGAGILVG